MTDSLPVLGATDRVVAVVQARLGSMRFPAKVLSELQGRPALLFLLQRLSKAKLVDEIMVAIPEGERDDRLDELVHSWGFRVVRGSETDVLSRYARAAEASQADVIVRITGDCPFVDPELVDRVVDAYRQGRGTNCRTSPHFPNGFDLEVFSRSDLDAANHQATEAYDREHVTPWIRRHTESIFEIDCDRDCSVERVTLDEPEDLVVIRAVVEHFGHSDFTVQDVIDLMSEQPQLFEANRHLVRDEGATLGTSEKLWRRARRVIPGGTMLLSKHPDQFLPSGWPTYYSKSKGCEIWDLDNKKYFDLSLMGVGTNILGYAHPKVDEAVRKTIDAGNLTTLNCPEEVFLAEKLCELHPWADMAKFARSGGEACAIAVRIARAASGKPAVAVCGYHGWHDWYLSANLADDQALDGHLLPGLTPNGVPRSLQGLTRPFFYNDLEALRNILLDGDVGTVVMEVERSSAPVPGFLEGVRELTRKHGAVLIFDECTSGFRRNLGGLHLSYGIEPDIATFGKTLGNGYAITAVIGRREVMEAAQSTFISSTFWTERIGPTAALATLEVMAEEDAPQRVDEIGHQIRRIWEEELSRLSLDMDVSGLPALSVFSVRSWDQGRFKYEIIRAMLEKGFLAGPVVYTSIAHTPEVLDQYRVALSDCLANVKTFLQSDIERTANKNNGTTPQRGFGRLA